MKELDEEELREEEEALNAAENCKAISMTESIANQHQQLPRSWQRKVHGDRRLHFHGLAIQKIRFVLPLLDRFYRGMRQ